jgi:hypothetical protein
MLFRCEKHSLTLGTLDNKKINGSFDRISSLALYDRPDMGIGNNRNQLYILEDP